MVSARMGKWIFVGFLLVLALYMAYPPVRVAVKRERVVEKVARTQEEADLHDVELNQSYEAQRQVVDRTFLPLARGQKDQEVRVVKREEDGTVHKDVTTYVSSRVKVGLDIAGGTELVYELKPQEGETLQGKLSQTISILKRRIDPRSVKEFTIQPLGSTRVLIQVPKATSAEVEQLKNRLVRMGRLEFKLAVNPREDKENLYERAKLGLPVTGYDAMYVMGDPSGQPFLVKKGEAEITGRNLARAAPGRDYDTGLPAVDFSFNAYGSRRFASVTDRYRGWLLAIILDGELKSAPEIKERIAGSGQITGNFTFQEVQDMVNILHAGSLPMDLVPLTESTVDPTLGKDSIRRGIASVLIAGLIILCFIGAYYLACGLVADAALILNLVFLVGVLGLLGAALTLPGLAGILLTVGMAVDANVLIFERIREELAAGNKIHAALRNGYDRAYTTIIDANVTTLLTAIIMYIVGTGPVKGFAVTLSAGIVLSMFTSLFVTRLAFETLVAEGWMTGFKMFAFFRQPSFRFSRVRRTQRAST